MSEHMFSHGPDQQPRGRELELLEAVAKRHGLTLAIYPGPGRGPRWGFHGPNNLEDKVRAELDGNPVFRSWCARVGEV
jgi:hypothetical protein